jgi:hypothetical protein
LALAMRSMVAEDPAHAGALFARSTDER